MGIFQGRQIASLIGEVILALAVLIPFLLTKKDKMPKIGRGMRFWDYFWSYVYLLLIPNSTYAIFEIRHLLFLDNVADDPNLWSYLVFGGISLLGLVIMLWSMKVIMDYYAGSDEERMVYGLILSLACGFGAVAGLLDFSIFLPAIFPPGLLYIFINIFANQTLILLAAGASLTIFLLSFLIPKPS